MQRFSFFLVVLICFALSGCFGEEESAPPEAREWLGYDLADSRVTSLEGKEISLSTLKDGRPLVLNVWATWCPPCLKELPSLYALQQQGAFQVWAVSVDRHAEKVKAYLEKNNLEGLNVLWDPMGRVTREEWGAMQLPQTYLADEDFIVRGIEKGERVWDHPEMLNKINKRVKKKN